MYVVDGKKIFTNLNYVFTLTTKQIFHHPTPRINLLSYFHVIWYNWNIFKFFSEY